MKKKGKIEEKIENIEKREKEISKENKVEYGPNRRGVAVGVTIGVCVCLAIGGYFLVKELVNSNAGDIVSNAPESYDSGSFAPNGGSDSAAGDGGAAENSVNDEQDMPSNMQTESVPTDSDTPDGTAANTTIRDTGAMTVSPADDPEDNPDTPDNPDSPGAMTVSPAGDPEGNPDTPNNPDSPGGSGNSGASVTTAANTDGDIVIAPSEGVYTSEYSDVTVKPSDDVVTNAAQTTTVSAADNAASATEPADVWQVTTTAGTTKATTKATTVGTTAGTEDASSVTSVQHRGTYNEINDDTISDILDEIGTSDIDLSDFLY